MRHVASKIPSVNGEQLEGEQAKQAEAEAQETKRARRAAKREGHEDDLAAAAVEGGAGADANEEARLEQLYDQIAWPLGRKYGHPYDAFKLALTCVFLSPACICILKQTYVIALQGTGRRILVIAIACPTCRAQRPHQHDCTATDAPADQAACRYRAHLRNARRYRRHQKGSPCRREAEHGCGTHQSEACRSPTICIEHQRHRQGRL